ncbi:MAG: MBL fold metallo-hydrolase [Eubacteriales bacterium]|nr:MBL fold metallo-hydrolase [Eubacteriales bacterium]
MEVTRCRSDLLFSNMYLLTEKGHSLVIDPFEHYVPAKNFMPDLMLITHEHYDHISGVNRMKEKYGIMLMCSADCAQKIENPRTNAARYFDAFCELQTYGEQDMSVTINKDYCCYADLTFEDEIRFKWRENELWLFTLPGHSAGGIGIVVNNEIFFSGDSLFLNVETELRFPGGNKKAWQEISVKRLNQLSENLCVYPGHREKFMLKERKRNGSI